MSISITDQPSTYTPAYNENIVVASSTQYAQTNFRYRVEVLNSSSVVVATVDVFPDSNNLCVWDAKRIIENYITSNPTLTNITELSTCPDSYYNYTVRVTERYGSPLANQASGTTTAVYAFNASQKWREFTGYNQDTYFIKSGNTVQFLTNKPDQNIYPSENDYLHFGVQDSLLAKYARVRTYDSSGSLLQTVLITNNYWNIALHEDGRFMRMPSGWNLNSITGGDIASGAQPIITSSVASWKIDIVQSDGTTALTDVKTFTAATLCTPHDAYRVHFLNSLGGFDSFTFTRAHVTSENITRSSFEPIYGSVSGGAWSYAITEQRKKSFYTEMGTGIKLISDWLTDSQSAWLEELVTSPEIYVQLNNGDPYSAFVKNAEYTTKQTLTDNLFNLELDLELGKEVRQRW